MKILIFTILLFPFFSKAEYRTFEYQTSLKIYNQLTHKQFSKVDIINALETRFEKQHKKICYQNRALYVRVETVEIKIFKDTPLYDEYELKSQITCDVL